MMENEWTKCKRVLVVRLDNMGDLLMSTPAIRALKQSFGCSVSLLTSSMAAGIASHLTDVDEVITADVPWVKSDLTSGAEEWNKTIREIGRRKFDAVVVFTVFSQNPMPAILLGYLAGIPRRLAYCRENPYQLLTHWVPDPEPYSMIRHQVLRDLQLVETVGATTRDHSLSLSVPQQAYSPVLELLAQQGINTNQPWIIMHPCASERKRELPTQFMAGVIRRVIEEMDVQVVITGTAKERAVANEICTLANNDRCRSLAGSLCLEEFMALIDIAPLVVSVNTGTVHIAAALNTPVVVLYARTNPQHTPWEVPNEVILFPVGEEVKSKNEVLKYVDGIMPSCLMPQPSVVVESIRKMLRISAERIA